MARTVLLSEELKCGVCGHEWRPRKKIVKICPHCKSINWDKEKTSVLETFKIGSIEYRVESYKDEPIITEWDGGYWQLVEEKDYKPTMFSKITRWKTRMPTHQ